MIVLLMIAQLYYEPGIILGIDINTECWE